MRAKISVLPLLVVLSVVFMNTNEADGASIARSRRANDMYTTKYDNIDVDAILASKRLLRNYVNCLLDKGACTNEGKELKKYLADALATECSKCSETQKKIASKVLNELLLNHRDDWNQLTAKYDPDGNFRAKYEFESDDYSDLEDA
ncbi:ejaculatory bulb-specific protein 3-like [Sitophilus oryzae]|uniref:Ejaculatory bulb-specific protein 3-like n=1 Tax=Sitophilus oryzae TaxID=7048 RepID=A0A6J2XFP8_SITOR|nr:ejaculatory bulb-specific protein 3-like [Sitophilus oryzae]